MAQKKISVSFFKSKKVSTPLLFILPAALLMALVVFYPLINSIWLSLHRYKLTNPDRPFIGLENYVKFLKSEDFRNSLVITAKYTIGSVVGSFLIGFALALLLKRSFKGRGIIRSILILPWAVPGVAAITVFMWLFDFQFGALNYILTEIGLVESRVGWLTNPEVALNTLIIVMVWKYFPVAMLFLLAGLQSIPEEYYEAARVDGAGVIRRFISITLPMIRGVMMVVLLFLTIFCFGQFTFGFIMTGGGPAQATETFVLSTYITAFKLFKFGYGATIGTITLLFTLIISFLYIRVGEARVYD
jgi:multiple sugar transport system permease protein